MRIFVFQQLTCLLQSIYWCLQWTAFSEAFEIVARDHKIPVYVSGPRSVFLSSLLHNFFLAGWHFFPGFISCGFLLVFFYWLDLRSLGLWAKLPLTLKKKGDDQECNSSAFSYSHCSSAFKICLCKTQNLAFSWTYCFYVSFKLTTIYIFNNNFFQILMNFVFFQWKRNKQMQRSCLFCKPRLGSLERKNIPAKSCDEKHF